MKIELWKHPAGFGWFVCVDGLQNCDIPYSSELSEAIQKATAAYPGVVILTPDDADHSANKKV